MARDVRTGLTASELREIRSVLKRYDDKIIKAAFFGSRANGRWRPESDIDLVLYGPISEREVDRLWTDFSESNLSMTVDVISYERIAHSLLRAHIDEVALPLSEDMEVVR